MSIDKLGLMVRTSNCLKRAGIFTVAELCRKTKEEVASIPNFGPVSLDDVRLAMALHGLCFKDDTLPTGIFTADITPPNEVLLIYGADDKEILRFLNDGKIYLHGELVDDDKKVVDGFREFLSGHGLY